MKSTITKLSQFAVTTISLSSIFSLNFFMTTQVALANSVNKIPVILDDDGSQDGMTAWSYMLANPKFDVKALTISQGIAHPDIFVDNVELMLGRLNDFW